LQIPENNNAIENGGSADELSLALYEMASLPEFLPVLSVIPEVRWIYKFSETNICQNPKSTWHILDSFVYTLLY
jgi:hypothetical protein